MQKHFLVLFFVAFSVAACQKNPPSSNPDVYLCNLPFQDSSIRNPNHVKYQKLLDDMVWSGIPGIMMSIYKPSDGMWVGAAGKADIEKNVAMRPCNRTRVGSTVKTFTAATILLLVEEGRLGLDEKAATYLPQTAIEGIENADKATIRQLLQHSSGIYNYIQNPKFQTASLNDLTKEWFPDELLAYARNEKAYFKPGEDVRYSNTGYIFLGMIIEKVTGKPFWQIFKERLFLPLQLNATSFAATDKVPKDIVRGYVDMYSNFRLVDATFYSGWDYYTADGGLISNTYDLNVFLNALLNGKILKNESLKEMLTSIIPKNQDEDFFETQYGLGIFKRQTDWGAAWMHSGDAIGYYASMAHFPDKNITITWAVNGNYGKLDELFSSKKAIEKIFNTVFP